MAKLALPSETYEYSHIYQAKTTDQLYYLQVGKCVLYLTHSKELKRILKYNTLINQAG